MFRKRPLRTYQRKNAIQFSRAENQSSIIREDIPEDNKLQPAQFLPFTDSDKSSEYDPFDTTFDRMLRETKEQPMAPIQDDNLAYSSSSDDEMPNALPPPSPLMNPRPMIQRRIHKRLKINLGTAFAKPKPKKREGNKKDLYETNSSVDENAEPNTKGTQPKKRVEKKKIFVEPKNVVKKKRRIAEKSAVTSFHENIQVSNELKHCTVNLTRMTTPLDQSMAALNLDSKDIDDKQITQKSTDTNEIKVQTESAKNIDTESGNKQVASIFKNPIVSLIRLKGPRFYPSIANKSWLSSTPNDRIILRPKSTLRLSPIKNETLIEKIESPAKVATRMSGQSKDFTPKNSKITKPSNLLGQLMRDSIKTSIHILSDSTDPEPSSLLFDDTEIPRPVDVPQKPTVETVNITDDDQSTAPLKGFERETATTLSTSEKPQNTSPERIEDRMNATEVSISSPCKGFAKESPDSGSLHLTYSDSDDVDESSNEITRSRRKKRLDAYYPSTSTGNQMDVENAASFKGFTESQSDTEESVKNFHPSPMKSAQNLGNISEDDTEDFENISEDNDEDISGHEVIQEPKRKSQTNVKDTQHISQKSVEYLQSISPKSVNSENISIVNVDDTENISQKSVDYQNILNLGVDTENISQKSVYSESISYVSIDETKNISQKSVDSESISYVSVDDTENISQKNVDSENISNVSVHTENISQESVKRKSDKDLQSTLQHRVEDARIILKKSVKNQLKITDQTDTGENSRRSDSEDEWATTSVHPSSDASIESHSETSATDSTQVESIVQVNSDDSESCGDIGEFVNASENMIEIKNDIHESSFETNYNSKIIKAWNRRSKQPIVLLSRLTVPFERSNKISAIKNSEPRKSVNERISIRKSSLNITSGSTIKSANVRETVSEPMEIGDNEESQTSQSDSESLKMDEDSNDTFEESAITNVSEKDFEKSSFRPSIGEETSENDESDTLNEEENSEALEASSEVSEADETLPKILVDTVDVGEFSMQKLQSEEKEKLDNGTIVNIRRSNQPIVLLSPLKDSTRITERRKVYRNWGELTAITENITDIEEEPDELQVLQDTTKEATILKELQIKLNREDFTKISQNTSVSSDISVKVDQELDSVIEDKIVFLKPGKSWSRSLSVYRQIYSQEDLDFLSINKGKKWRQSVQGILDMQHQGVIQSCFKKNEDDKKSRSYNRVRNSAAALWTPGSSQPNPSRVFSQSSVGSPGRFVRRVSIRVVPDRKNSELYEDSPFLEAYGITTSENRKTIGKRSTLIEPRASTLDVYNVHRADVTFDSIPKSLKTATSRDVVLTHCGQQSSLAFSECYPDLYLQKCRKIGEGVFGEVFLYEKGSSKSVIKIIPIEGDLKVNGERQKKFDEILSEIVIAKELNNLRFGESSKTSGFVEVKNIRCVIGKYPAKLIDLWKDYDDEKNSENDCPDMFDKNQLYIVLELGHGGQDLEAFVFQNSSECHALFIQTALALAVAEESLEFEHRDLHWGNLLISRTEESQITYKLRDRDISVSSKGVKVSVIDFTLSRMSYQGCSMFNDLSLDDDLFAAQGEYQFEIYRLMRQKVQNNWQKFEPFTNILWLHYTLDKMITAARYRRTSSKIHKNGITKLQELKAEILNYKSAFDFVTNCDNVKRLQGSRSSTTTTETAD